RVANSSLHARRLDVADADGFAALVDEVVATHGRLDWLVNNAGIVGGGELADMSLAQERAIVDTNLWGVLHGSRLAAAHMRRRRAGHIVNVASMAAMLPVPYSAVYTATKHAVLGFSLALREELREYGVGVHCFCPDIVDTSIFDTSLDNDGYDYRRVIDRHAGRAIGVDVAVRCLVDGVARDAAIIFAPSRSRILGTLSRLAPSWLAHFAASRMRAQNTSATTTTKEIA
ncbi:MAG TPA: SDR family NAD(P)-dependent oxidoreductase, partial [Polyangia bacterium]|nr:SDR family NAD(P)-dependent oxidoreductase [Polyangia bacterium]